MSYYYRNVEYRKRTINVDSRARDPVNYPNPNNFQIRFGADNFQDVLYIKLLDAQIPNTQYNVNENNNGFSLVDNGIIYDVLIPPCNYDLASLIIALNDLLNGISGITNTYTVTESCGKLVFTSNNVTPFELLFDTGIYSDHIAQTGDCTQYQISINRSARTILGFNIKDYESNSAGIIYAPNLVDLNGEQYILMELGTERYIEDVITPNASIRNAFFKIPLTVASGSIESFKNYYEAQTTFTPVIKDMRFLNIQFKTFSGKFYDFEGYNPSFTLEIGTLK